jgi:NAD kinase
MPAPDTFTFPARRVRVYFDREKREAEQVAAALAEFESPEPAAIIVVGGDGTLLRAIRQHWDASGSC